MPPLQIIVVRPLARLLAYQRCHDGRIVLVIAVALYVTVVSLAWLIWQVNLWPWLGVPPGPSLFFDTQNVLAALECSRLGYDPLVDSPCDPWQRPMFYPRVWLALQWLGLDQSHTYAVGVLIAVLFIVMLCLLVGRIGIGEAIVVAAAVCSPAVMFALQRGNMDVVLFSVLVVSVVLWRRGGRTSQILSPAVVLLAAFGKLYPVFGLPAYLLLRNRRAAVAAYVSGALFIGYLAITFQDVLTIARTATQGQYYSYGARILLGVVYHHVVGQNWEGASIAAQALTLVPLAALAVCLWLWSRRLFAPAPTDAPALSPELLGFYLGSLIYLGTFAVFKNYDYRLVYLLLTLPQLFAWVRDGRPAEPRTVVAAVALASLILELWIGALSEPLMLGDELVSWALAGLLVVLLAASVPAFGTSAVPRPQPKAQSRWTNV
jgi:hypothetical protein